MENLKSGFVALIGRPNVGKSTLMNKIIGQKIAITSHKPQTTRNKIQTVYTDQRGQIIFVDTPGIHKAKNKLGAYMQSVVNKTLKDVDVLLWIVEANDYIGEREEYILNLLKESNKPVILAINKLDILEKKELLLPIIEKYSKLMCFTEIVPISALKEDGIDIIVDSIYKYLPEGPLYYDADVVTDQPIRQISAELIREKLLRNLDDEIPHGVAVEIDKMEYRKNGLVDIEATIVCERAAHKAIIIGKEGNMLKKIGINARKDIEALTNTQVNLRLWLKVRKEWRNSDIQIKNFGYNIKDI